MNHFSDRKFTPEAGEEERAIIRLFVRETEDRSVKATINYTIPTPEECPLGDGDAEEVVPDGEVMNIGVVGGRNRTIGHCDVASWNIVTRDGLPVALID